MHLTAVGQLVGADRAGLAVGAHLLGSCWIVQRIVDVANETYVRVIDLASYQPWLR